ncbi:NTF2 domain-containing protein [Mycena sanguinolenta]|uniref:NTF2 domain-containing protein n=1 Tax=Mycena sanguinolenta TaxID=230812 RepID=A0A8H6XNM3_9AGAR|nr:NTF2 domain-containing protein [Mycena sanguinolenta]
MHVTSSRVIWALDSLRHISAAYIKLEAAKDEELHLGAASSIRLRLPALQHLALKGNIQDFVEQAAGWSLPSLRHVSLNCGTRRSDLPDTLAFLAAHGADLTSLDLYAIPAMPLARILALCPALTTLAFDGDWRVLTSADPSFDGDEGDTPPLAHDRITTNDCTLDLLTARAAFPLLRTIRVLSPDLLEALDRADGPAPGEGMKRWERWWQGCTHVGGEAGRFDWGESDGEEESEVEGELVDGDTDEEESDDDEYDIPPSPTHRPNPSRSRRDDREWRTSIPAQGGPQLDELRQLLAECRAMDAGRDDNYLFRNPGAMAMLGVGEGGWVLMRSGSGF